MNATEYDDDFGDNDDSFMGKGYDEESDEKYTKEMSSKNSKKNEDKPFSMQSIQKLGQHVYPHEKPISKEVLKIGNTSVALSQAKLYGINVENNKVKMPSSSSITNPIKLETKLKKLAAPRGTYMKDYDSDEEESLQKSKFLKKQAMKAMRNPRCGYDFVERLNDRGDIVDRLSNTTSTTNKKNKGMNKAEKDQLEQDYNAKLDKLYCPKCKKPQSFDEYFEKKRLCSLCNERFTKLVVCHLSSFEARMRQNQEKKEAKLAELDSLMYGNVGTMNITASNMNTNMSKTTPYPSSSSSSTRPETNTNSKSSTNNTMKVKTNQSKTVKYNYDSFNSTSTTQNNNNNNNNKDTNAYLMATDRHTIHRLSINSNEHINLDIENTSDNDDEDIDKEIMRKLKENNTKMKSERKFQTIHLGSKNQSTKSADSPRTRMVSPPSSVRGKSSNNSGSNSRNATSSSGSRMIQTFTNSNS